MIRAMKGFWAFFAFMILAAGVVYSIYQAAIGEHWFFSTIIDVSWTGIGIFCRALVRAINDLRSQ